MYASYYALEEHPFRTGLDPRRFWRGAAYGPTLAALESGLRGGAQLLVLSGEAGTGKSLLASVLVERLGERAGSRITPFPGQGPLDLFRMIAAAQGLDRRFASREVFLGRFRQFVAAMATPGRPVVVTIDEAQSLSPESLKEIQALLGAGSAGSLAVVLVGSDTWGVDARDLARDAATTGLQVVVLTLRPLEGAETAEYIWHHLQAAGATENPFTPDAMREVAAYSGGLAGVINSLCDLALVLGHRHGSRAVEARLIVGCARSLGLASAADGRRPLFAGAGISRRRDRDPGHLDAGVDDETPARWWSGWRVPLRRALVYGPVGALLLVVVAHAYYGSLLGSESERPGFPAVGTAATWVPPVADDRRPQAGPRAPAEAAPTTPEPRDESFPERRPAPDPGPRREPGPGGQASPGPEPLRARPEPRTDVRAAEIVAAKPVPVTRTTLARQDSLPSQVISEPRPLVRQTGPASEALPTTSRPAPGPPAPSLESQDVPARPASPPARSPAPSSESGDPGAIIDWLFKDRSFGPN